MQNSLNVQVLRSPVLAALLHGTPAAGVSQLRRGTRNGITELSQRAPPIFLYSAGRPARWASAHILVKYLSHIKPEALRTALFRS